MRSPVESCRGTRPSQALKSRPHENAAPSPIAATMALGILLIGLRQGYQVDLFSYLFGSILAVTKADLWMSAALGAIVLAAVAVLFKELLFITFDPEMAEVTGVPAGSCPRRYLLKSVSSKCCFHEWDCRGCKYNGVRPQLRAAD